MGPSRESLLEKVALLKRLGLFDPAIRDFRVQRAVSPGCFREAVRLIQAASVGYSRLPGSLSPKLRLHDVVPENALYVARSEGAVVGVMGIVPDAPDRGLPSDGVGFRRELDLVRRMGRRWAEIGSFAVDPAGPGVSCVPELVRACVASAYHEGCDDVFIAVPRRYARLFEEVLQFDPWGRARSGRAGQRTPLEGKRLDLHTLRHRCVEVDRALRREAFLTDWYFGANPHHEYMRIWSIMSAALYHDAGLLHEVLIEDGGLADLSPQEEEALRRRWGETVFDAVMKGRMLELAPA